MTTRIAPQAVCRQLLANLKSHKPLAASEEVALLSAIETCGIENAANRLIATLSRNAVKTVLDKL